MDIKLKPSMSESFHFSGGKVGCLLSHGFTGTPNEVLEIGEFLAENNFTVTGPLLPGHGTNLNELIETKANDWYDAYLDAFDKLSVSCEEVFIGGLSMGAALSLRCAIDREISGLILMAPPYRMNFIMRSFLAMVTPFAPKVSFKKTNKTLQLAKELDNICYTRDPIGPANSFRLFLKENRKLIPKISVPTLIFQGLHDSKWIIDSAKQIYNLISSIDKEIIFLENSPHCLTLGPDKDQVKSIVLNFINKFSTNR